MGQGAQRAGKCVCECVSVVHVSGVDVYDVCEWCVCVVCAYGVVCV